MRDHRPGAHARRGALHRADAGAQWRSRLIFPSASNDFLSSAFFLVRPNTPAATGKQVAVQHWPSFAPRTRGWFTHSGESTFLTDVRWPTATRSTASVRKTVCRVRECFLRPVRFAAGRRHWSGCGAGQGAWVAWTRTVQGRGSTLTAVAHESLCVLRRVAAGQSRPTLADSMDRVTEQKGRRHTRPVRDRRRCVTRLLRRWRN